LGDQINVNIGRVCSTHDKEKCIQKLIHKIRRLSQKTTPKASSKLSYMPAATDKATF